MGSTFLLEAQAMSPLIQPHCSCDEGSTSQHLLCMELHVFIFCIILSAVASGVVVASKSLFERLNGFINRSINGPDLDLKHRHVSRSSMPRVSNRTTQPGEVTNRSIEAPLEHHDTVPARYVRAFCGNEAQAWERWRATLAWRRENDIDNILNEPQPFFHEIRRHFPSFMSGRDRGGHIVVYEKLGEVNMQALRELGVTVPMLLRHWIFVSEYMYRVLQPTDSAQQMTIEDMRGVKIQALAGKIQDYIKGAAHLARLYYVERCHKTYVVNAPAWFGLAFGIISPLLSPRTRQKIRILGSDLSILLDEIDPELLPTEYGGRHTTPVQDSAEERHLRRLVDAVNANASGARDRKHGTPSHQSTRTPTRRHKERLSSPSGSGQLSPRERVRHDMPPSSEPRTRSRWRPAESCPSPESADCVPSADPALSQFHPGAVGSPGGPEEKASDSGSMPPPRENLSDDETPASHTSRRVDSRNGQTRRRFSDVGFTAGGNERSAMVDARRKELWSGSRSWEEEPKEQRMVFEDEADIGRQGVTPSKLLGTPEKLGDIGRNPSASAGNNEHQGATADLNPRLPRDDDAGSSPRTAGTQVSYMMDARNSTSGSGVGEVGHTVGGSSPSPRWPREPDHRGLRHEATRDRHEAESSLSRSAPTISSGAGLSAALAEGRERSWHGTVDRRS